MADSWPKTYQLNFSWRGAHPSAEGAMQMGEHGAEIFQSRALLCSSGVSSER